MVTAQATLEHLAVARRPDQRYQLINRSTKKPLTRHAFETVEHCAEAAAELERTFELSGMLALDAGEGLENIESIVLAAVAREQVALRLAA